MKDWAKYKEYNLIIPTLVLASLISGFIAGATHSVFYIGESTFHPSGEVSTALMLIIAVVFCTLVIASIFALTSKINEDKMIIDSISCHHSLKMEKQAAEVFKFKSAAADFKMLLDRETFRDNRIRNSINGEVIEEIVNRIKNVGYDSALENIGHTIDESNSELKVINPQIENFKFESSSKRICRDPHGNFLDSDFIGMRHEFKECGVTFHATISAALTDEFAGKVIKADGEKYMRVTGKDRRTVYFPREEMVKQYVEEMH